jgi:transposase
LPINGHAFAVAEVLDGPERRRRWSAEEKARIVGESLEPDVVASSVARRYGLHRNQLYAWRRDLRGADPAGHAAFVPAVVADPAPTARRGIEISFGGAVIRVDDDVDPAVLAKILRTLKRLG